MKDLLDLCRLNLMEENIENYSSNVDADAALKALDWAKRRVMERIKATQPPASNEVMEQHRITNDVE